MTDEAISAAQLRKFIERIERLEEDKQAVSEDIKVVFEKAKWLGYDTKALRTIVRLRKKDRTEREEEEAIIDLYMSYLVME